ncbi:MAG: tyrosine-type recombinase/integrase [Planctomycetota bacterium]
MQGQGTRKFTKLTFHSLRHSFNSTLANAGVSPKIRCKLTGHSSFSMNDRYTKFNIPPLQSAIQTIPSMESLTEDIEPPRLKAKPTKKPSATASVVPEPTWEI